MSNTASLKIRLLNSVFLPTINPGLKVFIQVFIYSKSMCVTCLRKSNFYT